MEAYLHPAFVWDCDACGEENFVRAIRIEKTEEEMAEMRSDLGIEEDDDGEFLGMPSGVMCQSCGTEYECADD